MKFKEWKAENEGRSYLHILQDILVFEDQDNFINWCVDQRIEGYGADWAMLAFTVLHNRVLALEKEKDKKK